MAFRYEKAPIIEAVIDIRVDPKPGLVPENIEGFLNPLVKPEYPKIAQSEHLQGHTRLAINPTTTFTKSKLGVDYYSQDGTQIFRAHRDGFTFCRLAPYTRWTEVRQEAHRLWELYKRAVPVAKVVRIGVRYINKIDFPPGQLEFEDYLHFYPKLPTTVPDVAAGLSMRVEIPQTDLNGIAVIGLAGVPSQNGGVSLILDIDLFKFRDPLSGENDPWDDIEILAARKNEYFEASITEKTRTLFGERIPV